MKKNKNIIAYKEAESPDSLLQQIPTPHLPENKEEPKERILKLGRKVGQPGMFHEDTGSKATAEDIQKWMEQQKNSKMTGLAQDVSIEERITEKDKNKFKGNI